MVDTCCQTKYRVAQQLFCNLSSESLPCVQEENKMVNSNTNLIDIACIIIMHMNYAFLLENRIILIIAC